MTVRIDVLRKAIAYLRANPDEYDQQNLCYRKAGNSPLVTCVIGRAALMEGAYTTAYGDIYSFPGGGNTALRFGTEYLGLSEVDFNYIYASDRTLNEIEASVNEIASREATRENPPVADNRNWEKVTLKIKDNTYIVSPGEVEAIVMGARAVDPNVRIVKVTEEVL